jgi:hypothetical protein
MKRAILAIVASLCILPVMVGCAKQVNAPLPAMAVDQVDADVNSILQPAHAFAAALTKAVQSTDPQVHIELTAAQKSVLVALNKALNIADPLEQAYHAQPTSTAATQLQTAAAQVSSAFTAAQAAIPVTGK